ncbi:uncharacterized protein LOC123546432 [Mercenaria mercenaria]|uniref:uncharacterized protein LOC123546432 n=1 Tax=Mercenaria mercenaria TaxID=6596 RepID=UPI00234F1DA3|nr:uncharacterized protein LOC123546432 [Mercenaria mercenaria]
MEINRLSFTAFTQLGLISLLVLLSPVESAKKCSRTLKRIPVHKGFDLNKFAGTWYTITRTTLAWGDNTFKSFSIEIGKNEDGSFHFSYTGQIGDKCLPVESGTLVKNGRPGHYILRVSGQSNNHATIIISFTDYRNMALVYYCFKYRPGSRAQCQKNGMQIEIMSKDLTPKKKDANAYIKRSGKRLCAPAKLLEATQPGLCKIPDILAAAKQTALDLKDDDTKTSGKDHCAVNNIPVQQNFNSSQLQGLWYEIARTRFTFNKMESVVNFHRYDEETNQIYSYYTGTVVSQNDDDSEVACMTAIQGMSKTAGETEPDSNRLGKIGWDDFSFHWSPTKVLYADDDYILFYACYSGETDTPCNKMAMEVTLSGRSRNISQEKRDTIYDILPQICVNPDDMIETQFLTNCTSWVTIQPEDVGPEDCKLDDIMVYDDYINTQMAGTWFLYSSISYNNMTALNGVVMEKTLLPGSERIETRIAAFSPETDNCTEYRSRSRDMCIETADHIAVLPTGGDGNFVFSKVLYLDNDILVEYTCSARSLDGACDKDGIQFNVYTTNDTSDEDFLLADVHQDRVDMLAKSICLDPNDLQLQSDWCNISEFAAPEESSDAERCDIDQLTIFSDTNEYTQEGIYGYWYEVSRSSISSHKPAVKSAYAYFTSPSNETLNIYYTGLSNEETEGDDPTCSEVLHGSMIARCSNDINGDFLYRFNQTENFVSYVPFKIIFTDYTKVLVTYMCTEMLPDGSCHETGEEIILWSRNETLDDTDKAYAYDMGFWVCLQPTMTDNHQNNSACKQNLEEYVTDNHLDQLYEDDYDVSDDEAITEGEVDDNNDQQQDQGQNKYELSDIEAAFLMDDDEFYYNS